MTEEEYPAAPECDKLASHADESQQIGQFLDWMREEKDIVFAQYSDELDEDGFKVEWPIPLCIDINKLLAEYYEVDLEKVEEERRDILHYLRGKWKDEEPPKVKIVVTVGDDKEEMEIDE